MNRRGFIAGLGSAAAWPAMGRGQQGQIPVIGFLSTGSTESYTERLRAFRQDQ